jgi:hypothetical protein
LGPQQLRRKADRGDCADEVTTQHERSFLLA